MKTKLVPARIDRRLWRCDICGTVDVWGPGWEWYGSWADMEATGYPEEVSCSAACRAKSPHAGSPKRPA